MPVDPRRVTVLNDAPERPGDVVLYWMIAARRTRHNLALDHAADRARALGVPLVILEPLRCGYRWASPRHHTVVLRGMVDNARACADAGVAYHPYVEPEPGAGRGLLAAMASRARLVVTDATPVFFLPRMLRAAAAALDVRLEAVDGVGVIPLDLPDRDFTVAHSLRRWLHDRVDALLAPAAFPTPDPLADRHLAGATVPDAVAARWPAADLPALLAPGGLNALPLDHAVPPVPDVGGPLRERARLRAWVDDGLARYATDRNEPANDVGSGLSTALHFGHVGAHEIVRAVLDRDGWTADRVDRGRRAKNAGFWGTSPEVEAFLDEVLTWRELGHLHAHRHPDTHTTLAGNPSWAQQTLADHASDPRDALYSLDELTEARTHDPVWNAAQRQLVAQGRIHNYLRMLWGKGVLAWSPTPQEAVDRLIELNNRWALDGRDPNSYSGIFWTFGRYDRAWGPPRPVFGTVRYMSTDAARRKLDLGPYLARWSA